VRLRNLAEFGPSLEAVVSEFVVVIDAEEDLTRSNCLHLHGFDCLAQLVPPQVRVGADHNVSREAWRRFVHRCRSDRLGRLGTPSSGVHLPMSAWMHRW